MIHFFFVLSLASGSDGFIKKVVPLQFQGNAANFYSTAISPKRIFIAYPKSGVVLSYDSQGRELTKIGKKGQGPGEFNWPMAIFYDAPYLYVCDTAQDKLHRVDPESGLVQKVWSLSSISAFSVNGDQIIASFRSPQAGKAFAMGRLGDELKIDRYMGQLPCCLKVSGSRKSAVLQDSDGNIWWSYSGEFLLQKYSLKGKLIKSVTKEPIDYVVPSQPKKVSRYDTSALSANVMSFDKIFGLYEFQNQIIQYRYKRLDDSYLDIFDKNGRYITSKKSDWLWPIGVLDGHFYALYSKDDQAQWDVVLTRLNLK